MSHDYLQSGCQVKILFVQLFLYEFHYFSIITSTHGTHTHTTFQPHGANAWPWHQQALATGQRLGGMELKLEWECDAKHFASTQSLPPPAPHSQQPTANSHEPIRVACLLIILNNAALALPSMCALSRQLAQLVAIDICLYKAST